MSTEVLKRYFSNNIVVGGDKCDVPK